MAPPPDEVDESAADAGYGDAFEGFAGSFPSDRAESDQPALDAQPHDLAHQQKQFVRRPVVQDEKQNSGMESGDEDGRSKPLEDEDESRRVAVGSSLANARRVAESSGMLGSDQFSKQGVQSGSEVDPDKLEGRGNSGSPVVSSGLKVAGTADRNQVGMRGPFLARLQEFSEVIRRDLGAQAMFLIDNEGGVILDEVENAKLVRVAQTLANASFRARQQTVGAAVVGNLHVKISVNATLEVIPVESSYGLLVLGVIFPAPIGSVRVMQVAKELFRTIEPR